MSKEDPPANAFEADIPGTAARDSAEAAIEALRARGGVFVEAVRATRMAMALTDPTLPGNPIVFANEAFLELTGYVLDDVLGQQPYFLNGCGTDPEDAERFRAALAADRDVVVETVQYRKDGSRFVATVLLSAFKDDAGRTLNHFLSWMDVTDRADAEQEADALREAQARLRESEEKYRTLFETMEQAYAVVEVLRDEAGRWADFRFLEVNPAFGRHTAMPHPVGKTAAELLGTPNPRWAQLYGEALDSGKPLRVEESEATLGRTFDLSIVGLDRERSRVAVLFSDVTERRKAEQALRQSEQRLRLIVENARDYAIFTMDLDGRIADWREGAEAVFGYSRAEIIGQDGGVLFTPEDRAAGEPETERVQAAAAGKAPNVRWHVCKDGRRVFIEGVCTAIHDPDGRATGFLKIGRDATERRASEERQRLLLAELQHRVRNILFVIRSVFARTIEAGGSIEDIAEHFRGRLDALARTQVVLTHSPGSTVNLEDLIREELLSVGTGDGPNLSLEGPEVELSPEAAESLGLVAHELITNSVKYGALSFPSATLTIRWSVNLDYGGKRRLVFSWIEQGVPAVSIDPGRAGFGTELITQALPYRLGAETSFELRPGGVRCVIDLPLPDIVEESAQSGGAR